MVNPYSDERIVINELGDITRRPRFEASVPPRKSLFRYVVAVYSFPRKVASCSVSDCYQNHKKGYLIHTADGGECSVCESCAARFMTAQMLKPPRAKAVRTAGTDTSRAAARVPVIRTMSVADFTRQCEQIKAQVKELKLMARGANWVFQSLANFRKAYPAELLSALEQLRQGGEESSVFQQLIENDASDEQLQAVEQLQGLEALHGDIRALLVDNILKPLGQLELKAPRVSNGEEASVPADWEAQVEADLAAAQQLINQAQLFFEDENLRRLTSIPLSNKGMSVVAALRWDVDKGGLK